MNAKQAASYSTKDPKGQPVLFAGDRLTKEELELVVQKHNAGLLVVGGRSHFENPIGYRYCDSEKGCIMQHINRDPRTTTAFNTNKAVAAWFDDMYKATWPDWMLRDMMLQAKLIEEDE